MHSSSAYPTSIQSSDVVTKDRPAVDARVGARHRDTTAGFTLGLIPQLIDLLHILTEGQDLLARKISAARHDESSRSVPSVDRLGRFQIPAVQPLVGCRSATVESPSTRPSRTIDLEGETARTRTVDIHCSSDPDVDVSDADSSLAGVQHEAPPPAVTIADVIGDSPSEPGVPPMLLESVPSSETAISMLRRDYNFFDELDARLASLQDPPG